MFIKITPINELILRRREGINSRAFNCFELPIAIFIEKSLRIMITVLAVAEEATTANGQGFGQLGIDQLSARNGSPVRKKSTS